MKYILTILAAATLVGCATPEVTQVRKLSDKQSQCNELQRQIEDAKVLEKKAEEEKGWTGGNVVRGLFFWPAIIGTNMNANEAIQASKQRQDYLVDLMEQKGCK
jgi:hypothetical protein